MKAPHIAVVAGEISGDLLGGPLIRGLREIYPDARFTGIGGDSMQQAGLTVIGEMNTLSVMGFTEVISHLPSILRLKKQILSYWQNDIPDIYIGIDAPDFNLRIAKTLHQRGIKTVQYVSPSIWAWKEKRIFTIKAAIDKVLCLFPFETNIYHRNQVKAVCVGHSMKDRLIPMTEIQARKKLALPSAWQDAKILGIFPGSRSSEIERLLPIFLNCFTQLVKQHNNLNAFISISQTRHKAKIRELVAASDAPKDRIILSNEASETLMSASNALLLASGTITLEAALLNRPMAVAYKVAPLTAAIARRLIKIRHFSLPNLLAGREIVHEWIQEYCTVENINNDVEKLLFDQTIIAQQQADLKAVSDSLPSHVAEQAAKSVKQLLDDNR